MAVFDTLRVTTYDWACVRMTGADTFEVVSQHTRQDKAITACQNRVIADPDGDYAVVSGRWKVLIDRVALAAMFAPQPEPEPIPEPEPEPPIVEPSFGVRQGPVDYLPIIPGIRGWGTETVGGSGRHLETPQTTVLHVTSDSTADEGEVRNGEGFGTYTWCLNRPFPRTIVFDVSGMAVYRGAKVAITNPYMTIAWHTAPSPGFRTYGLQVSLQASDLFLWHQGICRDNGVGGPGNTNDLQFGGGTGEYRRIVVANPDLLFGWDEGYSVFCNSTSKVYDSTIWQPLIALGQFSGSAFGSLVDFGAGGGPFRHSCIRPLFIKNRRRCFKGVDGYIEVIDGGGYDNDFNHEIQCHRDPKTTAMNFIGNVAVRGQNGGDQINSFMQTNAGFEGAHIPGGTYHLACNRRFSDYVKAVDYHNPTGEVLQPLPSPLAASPGLVSRRCGEGDEAIKEHMRMLAAHCGSAPRRRHPFVQSLMDGMLSYLDGGVDPIPRIDIPEDIGWPIQVPVNRIDHAGARSGDPMPTGPSAHERMPSGWTRFEEWLHRRNRDVSLPGCDL